FVEWAGCPKCTGRSEVPASKIRFTIPGSNPSQALFLPAYHSGLGQNPDFYPHFASGIPAKKVDFYPFLYHAYRKNFPNLTRFLGYLFRPLSGMPGVLSQAAPAPPDPQAETIMPCYSTVCRRLRDYPYHIRVMGIICNL